MDDSRLRIPRKVFLFYCSTPRSRYSLCVPFIRGNDCIENTERQIDHGRKVNNPWLKMSMETIPKDLRGLRACLVCSLIKVWNTNSS